MDIFVGKDSRLEFRQLAPGDYRLFADVGSERRSFGVHIPERKKEEAHPVFAFDGVTIWNQKGHMGRINGLSDASEKYGFAAIYPVPKTRYWGIIAGWNTRGGYLDFHASYDDVDFVSAIFAMLKLDYAYAVGFSAGAQFAHILAGRLAGSILGVGSIAGTWLGTEPLPPVGTALMVVHGENDTVQPYEGVRRGLRVRALALLGNDNVLLSRPDRQARAYAAANGYGPEPVVEETGLYTKRTFGPGPVPVVEYLMRHPYEGHTYHGRKTGWGTESIMSPRHGRPAPPEIFNCNDVFAVTMGFAKK